MAKNKITDGVKAVKENKIVKLATNFLSEFKAFALKGNVIDLAVGVIIGGAFTTVVTSLVDDIFMPIVGVFGGSDFDAASGIGSIKLNGSNYLKLGNFVGTLINFVIVALCIFLLIKGLNALQNGAKALAGSEEEAEEPKKPHICPFCKSEVKEGATRCPFCTSEIPLEADAE